MIFFCLVKHLFQAFSLLSFSGHGQKNVIFVALGLLSVSTNSIFLVGWGHSFVRLSWFLFCLIKLDSIRHYMFHLPISLFLYPCSISFHCLFFPSILDPNYSLCRAPNQLRGSLHPLFTKEVSLFCSGRIALLVGSFFIISLVPT